MTTPTPAPTRPATVVSVTTEGMPDAYRDGDHIIVELTPPTPTGGTEAVLRIPLADAVVWAAEAYVAVTTAARGETGGGVFPAVEVAHAELVITAHPTGYDPHIDRLEARP